MEEKPGRTREKELFTSSVSEETGEKAKDPKAATLDALRTVAFKNAAGGHGHEFFNGVSTLAQQEARAAKSATAGATEDDADCSRAAKRRRVESVADKGDPDDLCDAGATEDAAESVQEEAAATLSSDRTIAFAQRFKVFDVDKVKMQS